MSDIYVYAADCEDFTNFGLVGALEPTSCTFEEEANGLSEITLEHPLDDFGKYTQLICNNILAVDVPVRTTPEINAGNIVTSVEKWVVRAANTITKAQRTLYKKSSGSRKIKVVPSGTEVTVVRKPAEGRYKVKCKYGSGWMNPDGLLYSTAQTIADNSQSIESVQPAWTVKTQFFRIYNVEKGMLTVKVMARHISYDLLYNLTTFKNTAAVSCIDALAGIMDNCVSAHEFEGYTNLYTTRTGIDWTRVNPIDALLNPETGLTALYGASLVRDNWELYILHDPGLNRGVTIEYGKNMTGIKCTESFEEVVTRIIPVGETKDGDDLLLSGTPYVDSPRISDYPVIYTQELKCEDCKVGTDGVTTAIARARMREQAQAVFDDGGDLPSVEMSVEFINLGDTAEYAQFKNLERLFLWDYVIVRHKLHNIDVTSRIVSIKWDCLLDRMDSMEIGSVGKTLANSGITTWQIPTGFSGSKIAGGTVGSGALMAAAVSSKHIQSQSIYTEAMQAESVTAEKIASRAITADKLDVGSVTAETIAAGSVTAEKIAAGAIDAASIEAITAKIGSLTAEDITTDRLAAALAAFSVVTAGTASFDKATVSHLVANLFNLTGSGVMDDVFIHNLKIAYAQMVSASIGNLVLQASDGQYYQIDVDQNGSVSAALVEPSAEEIASGVFGQTRPILVTSMTVDDMNASSIKAVHMLINKIDAARIDVDQLFARQAFITQLTTSNIIGGKSLTIIAGEVESAASAAKNATKTYRQESAPDVADGVRNGDLWIKPSTGAISQADAIEFALDGNGDLYLNHASGDGHSARFSSDDPSMLETSFAMTLGTNGEITGMPVTWMLVQDQTLLNEILGNATSRVDVEYALGSSNEIAPTTGWKTEAPEQTEGQYIWSRTVTYFGDGTKSTGAAICISPTLGKSIAQIDEEYALGSDTENAPTTGWSADVPTPTAAKPYIWTCSKITYADGSFEYKGAQVQAKRYADILTDNLLDKVDGKTTVFYQPEAPTAANDGDLWYDTDADPVTIQRYSDGAWSDVTDSMLKKALEAAGDAKSIADGKIITFAQADEPGADISSEGDLWIDTGNGNKLHRYDGTAWVAYQDASISQAQSDAAAANANAIAASESASEALTKANAAVSRTDFQRVVRIDDSGLHVGDNQTDCEVLIDSASVNVVVGGEKKSTFGDNFVRLGNALISNTNNGLVIDLYGA